MASIAKNEQQILVAAYTGDYSLLGSLTECLTDGELAAMDSKNLGLALNYLVSRPVDSRQQNATEIVVKRYMAKLGKFLPVDSRESDNSDIMEAVFSLALNAKWSMLHSILDHLSCEQAAAVTPASLSEAFSAIAFHATKEYEHGKASAMLARFATMFSGKIDASDIINLLARVAAKGRDALALENMRSCMTAGHTLVPLNKTIADTLRGLVQLSSIVKDGMTA